MKPGVQFGIGSGDLIDLWLVPVICVLKLPVKIRQRSADSLEGDWRTSEGGACLRGPGVETGGVGAEGVRRGGR
jgi:hypothetical protein